MAENRRRFTIEEKLECARRELEQRRRVYAYRITQGKMTKQFADEQIDLMAQIVEDYERQVQSERLI